MKGKQITKVEQVWKLAQAKKAIWHERIGKRIPAAFIIGYQAHFLIGQIRAGWLYEYKKKAK